jgi:polysaccharide biosynthesis protein PslG
MSRSKTARRIALLAVLPVVLAACSSSSPASHERLGGSSAARPKVGALATTTAGLPVYGIAAGCCIQWMSATSIGNQLDAYSAIGAKWIRFDINWNDIQAGGPSSYAWANYDKVVNAATSRGIRVLGMLGYSPPWARPSGCDDSKCAPANVNDYATFAGAAAAHLAPLGVHAWEIWNEPNAVAFWKPSPNPAQYTRMLKAAYTQIKKADPSATVVTGGTAAVATNGTNYSPFDFDKAIYQNGAKGYFDALGHHPYCFVQLADNCPNAFSVDSAWSQMNATSKNLVGLMQAYGDGNKKIWGTEFGAPTNGVGAITEAQQATMVTNAYALWKTYSFTGPLFIYTFRDPGTDPAVSEDWFGIVHNDWTPKPAYYAYQASALSG